MDTPTQVDPRLGLVLNGRYRVEQLLGEGGMGVVYRGQRLQLDRPVAIKFLHTPYAGSPKFVARFDREARAMSRLSHPCCVSVIDFGVQDTPYIVMDFAPGETLRSVLDEKPFSTKRAVQVTRQILTGLAHAHEQGIVHRDIKPGNIMLGEATGMGDQVKIFDFGLAKLLDPSGIGDPSTTGVIGTPCYMAPEQTRGDKLDARVDLYATGIVLFELIAGQKPFDAPDTLAVLRMHREKPAPTLAEVGAKVSPELEAVVKKSLEKDPDQRFQTASEFMAALDAVPEAKGRVLASIARDDLALAPTQAVKSPRLTPSRGDPTDGKRPASSSGIPRFMRLLGWLALLSAGVWYYLRRPVLPPEEPGSEVAALAPEAANQPATAARPDAATDSATSAATRPQTDAGADAATEGLAQVLAEVLAEVASKVPAEAPVEAPIEVPVADAPPTPTPDPSGWVASDAGVFDISEADLAAADLALDNVVDSEAKAPEGEASSVKSLADVRALMNAGKLDEAIAGARTLRRRDPRNPELPYMIGDLYFQKGYWSDGLSRYREALKLRSGLKTRISVQKNAIEALGSDKTYARARALIVRDLGTSALERLKSARKHHASKTVRARAGSIVTQLTSKRRRGNWF